ncbi:hypothetical protein [Palaeococcus ferrophilus]|uniref:hypothetical protein n=1 Tax=Palaeococcus ferrophilus TaxID=83868 RepID=UPI00064E2A56|nr:hypothetical protein [Palaeococcus ferrophilus]
MRLSLAVPALFMAFIAAGGANYKTLVIGALFSLAFAYGVARGENVRWLEKPLGLREEHFRGAFVLSLLLILLQLAMIRDVPLIHPSAKALLNSRLTALTYLLGVPSSVYLFLRGKKYSLTYPILVALYAYRTPVMVSLLALGSAYLEERRVGMRHIAIFGALLGTAFFGLAVLRGDALSSQLVRVQATTSVLDVIVTRAPWHGFYHGALQWAGIRSYVIGGFSPRYLTARFLYINTGVSITSTLMGGMYLDFGLFSVIEALLLGLYFGVIGTARELENRVLYYTTLAYALVGVETGILDLPVYLFYLAGFYVVLRGKYRVVRVA